MVTGDRTIRIFENKTSLVQIPCHFWRHRVSGVMHVRAELIELFSKVNRLESLALVG
jgi:hypothetical protein